MPNINYCCLQLNALTFLQCFTKQRAILHVAVKAVITLAIIAIFYANTRIT
jgi:hypothetical protein